jgi:hypothetical protein
MLAVTGLGCGAIVMEPPALPPRVLPPEVEAFIANAARFRVNTSTTVFERMAFARSSMNLIDRPSR